MRALVWSVRLAIFLVLFAFASKNTEPVVLKFFFGINWQVSLVVLLLGFFACGALLGVVSMSLPLWRQRRRVKKLQAAAATPPAVDAVAAPRADLVAED